VPRFLRRRGDRTTMAPVIAPRSQRSCSSTDRSGRMIAKAAVAEAAPRAHAPNPQAAGAAAGEPRRQAEIAEIRRVRRPGAHPLPVTSPTPHHNTIY
jgi:hypothetical protein